MVGWLPLSSVIAFISLLSRDVQSLCCWKRVGFRSSACRWCEGDISMPNTVSLVGLATVLIATQKNCQVCCFRLWLLKYCRCHLKCKSYLIWEITVDPLPLWGWFVSEAAGERGVLPWDINCDLGTGSRTRRGRQLPGPFLGTLLERTQGSVSSSLSELARVRSETASLFHPRAALPLCSAGHRCA